MTRIIVLTTIISLALSCRRKGEDQKIEVSDEDGPVLQGFNYGDPTDTEGTTGDPLSESNDDDEWNPSNGSGTSSDDGLGTESPEEDGGVFDYKFDFSIEDEDTLEPMVTLTPTTDSTSEIMYQVMVLESSSDEIVCDRDEIARETIDDYSKPFKVKTFASLDFKEGVNTIGFCVFGYDSSVKDWESDEQADSFSWEFDNKAIGGDNEESLDVPDEPDPNDIPDTTKDPKDTTDDTKPDPKEEDAGAQKQVKLVFKAESLVVCKSFNEKDGVCQK